MPTDTAADVARITAVKAALVQTTATPGWDYAKKLAANIVAKNVEDALDEEDREKRDAKTLKASALKKGFADFFAAIETTKQFEFQNLDDGFGSTDFDATSN